MEDSFSDSLSLQQKAVNENLIFELTTDCTKISTEEARLIAQNPSALPALLQTLSDRNDTITRKHVAANPNTPTAVLLKLGSEFPLQLLDNPVFFLLLLENPNLFYEIPPTTMKSLLKQEKVPTSFLTWAAHKPDREMQLAVAMNAQTPKGVLEKLVGSQDRQVAEVARLHVNWAGELLGGWEEAVREAIQRAVFDTTDETSLQKSADIDEFAIGRLLENGCYDKVLKERVIEHLLGNRCYDEVLAAVVSNSNQTDFIERLAKYYNRAIRMGVAQNPNTPTRILEKFFRYEQWVFDFPIARNPNTPAKILEELVEDEQWIVRWSIARNPNTPTSLLEKLVRDKRWVVRLSVARNPKVPVRLLEQLLEDNEERVRRNVARYFDTSVSLLERWAGDEDVAVRRHAAAHPRTPASLLEQLVNDADGFVRLNVAKNPNLPASLLEQLVKDKDGSVRVQVAQHPDLPLSLLESLLSDRQPMVRRVAVERYLAQNPEGLPIVLEHCAKNVDSSYSRLLILLHPQISDNVLADSSCSSIWLDRYAIAQHPNTPVDTLHTLAIDANRIVRAAANANLQTRYQQQ